MKQVRLGFVGDIALHGAYCGPEQAISPFGGVIATLRSFDRVVGNLECALLEGPTIKKEGRLVVEASAVSCLDIEVPWVLCLANNHIRDGGAQGVQHTLGALEKNNIPFFGAGVNRAKAAEPLHVDISGIRAVFFGATDFRYSSASKMAPGACRLNKRQLLKQVKGLAKDCDLLIVILHADLEFVDHPAQYRRELSQSLIDAGAHLVIEHHPHVLQGSERYRHGFIAYSLGNFLFKIGNYQRQCTETKNSAILSVTVERSADRCAVSNIEWVPVVLDNDGRPRLAEGKEGDDIRARINRLSIELNDPVLQRRHWFQVAVKELKRMALELYYIGSKQGMRAMIRRLMFLSRETLPWYCVRGCLTLGRY